MGREIDGEPPTTMTKRFEYLIIRKSILIAKWINKNDFWFSTFRQHQHFSFLSSSQALLMLWYRGHILRTTTLAKTLKVTKYYHLPVLWGLKKIMYSKLLDNLKHATFKMIISISFVMWIWRWIIKSLFGETSRKNIKNGMISLVSLNINFNDFTNFSVIIYILLMTVVDSS